MRSIVLLAVFLPSYLCAGWTLLRQLPQPVSCAYFFDANRGLVGTCNNQYQESPNIWRTTNGGATWLQCTVPGIFDARMTSIFMKDASVGYASIMETDKSFNERDHALWKTTDGGLTWFDHTQGEEFSATCVYAISSRLIVSSWRQYNGSAGGVSSNDGRTYSQTLVSSSSDMTNGIDFSDALRGVVSPGPNTLSWFSDTPSPCLFTTDGGISWQEGGDMSESWGVYAVKGTSNFFALPEGHQNDDQTRLIHSNNVGVTWTTLVRFDDSLDFTGHIAGMGNTLYVQTAESSGEGLFRSDDLGQTWRNVSGPSNQRDTRFIVTGCKGEVVYAFDADGGVWKTTDGGDGTLAVEQVELGAIEPLPDHSGTFIAGDTLRIPVYYSGGSLSLSSYSLKLLLNTDLVTPFDVLKFGTLSSDATTTSITIGANSATVDVSFAPGKIIAANTVSQPLCYILARIYLTRDTTTELTLDSFSVNDDKGLSRNILACSGPGGTPLTFMFDLQCGDPVLYHFMRDEPLLDFSFVRPNPSSKGWVEIGVTSARSSEATLEAVNVLGLTVKRLGKQRLEQGLNTVRIRTSDIASGVYYLQLSGPMGTVRSNPVAISK